MMETIKANYGLVIGVVTSVVINRLSESLHKQKFIYPKNVLDANNEYYYWRYRNFFISFIHASLTGIGSLYCVIQTPRLLIDVIDTYSEFGYVLTSFSLGYFLYDTLEMMTHTEYKGTSELILHHILILLCFSNTIVYHKYIGYNMIALLIENSNIFLHFRQLLLLSNYPRSGQLYQVNCVVNLVFFVLIRGSCMFWLWYTLLTNLFVIPWITKTIALVAMVGISFTTVILFQRVLNADFIITGGSIHRRKVTPPRRKISGANNVATTNATTTNNGDKDNHHQQEQIQQQSSLIESRDLYESMEDSLCRNSKHNNDDNDEELLLHSKNNAATTSAAGMVVHHRKNILLNNSTTNAMVAAAVHNSEVAVAQVVSSN